MSKEITKNTTENNKTFINNPDFLKELKLLEKRMKVSINNAISNYEIVFKLYDYGYDLFVENDYIIKKIFLDFEKLLEEYNCKKEDFSEKIQKRWTHVFTSEKQEIENLNETKIEAFSWTYILLEMYIITSHILAKSLNINNETTYSELQWKHSFKFITSLKILNKWIQSEEIVDRKTFDETKKPPLCSTTYNKLHKSFKSVINDHYLLICEEDISKHLSKGNNLLITIFGTIVLLIFILIALVISLTIKTK